MAAADARPGRRRAARRGARGLRPGAGRHLRAARRRPRCRTAPAARRTPGQGHRGPGGRHHGGSCASSRGDDPPRTPPLPAGAARPPEPPRAGPSAAGGSPGLAAGAAAGRRRRLHRPRRAGEAAERPAVGDGRERRSWRGPHRRGGRRGRPRQDLAGRARGAPGPSAVPGRPAVRRPARRDRGPAPARGRAGQVPARPRGGRPGHPGGRGRARGQVPDHAGRPPDAGGAGQRARRGPGQAAAAGLRVVRGAGHDAEPDARPGQHQAGRPQRPRRRRGAEAVRQGGGRGAGRGRTRGHRRTARRLRRPAAGHQDLRGPAGHPQRLDHQGDGRPASPTSTAGWTRCAPGTSPSGPASR